MRASIIIPQKIKEKLDENPAISAEIQIIQQQVMEIFTHSGCPFFRQFTDHGFNHISGVLETIENLIAKKSWPIVSSNDAGTIILATFLHDIALHIQEDGFVRIIQGEWPACSIVDLDTKSWQELWYEYLSKIRRLDRRELKNIFGVEEPISPPDLSSSIDWGPLQYDLIGGFLREHHPRLAHEIALHGFPGKEILKLGSDHLSQGQRDLVGLIARSHGGPVRSFFPYLEKKFHLREFNKIHGPYLMVLLRIADYLQLQSDRVSAAMLSIKALRSPISGREWNLHQSIRNITTSDPDPEAIKIQIDPATIKIGALIRLKEWIQDLQLELDTGWAALGEVYGRYEDQLFNLLGLSIRRIRSDLDQNDFASALPYFPEKIKFESADADLLQLLIGPLYGEHPEIGIRELLQNAVDAVREVKFLLKEDKFSLIEFRPQSHDVVIELDIRQQTLTISDRGLGMSPDVIRDYFLKAGASFRRSDAWRKSFVPRAGEPAILRTGRFGIGALAAFLLGDKIKVETRNIYEDKGIKFSATLDDNQIELSYVDIPVGTSIQVDLTEETIDGLFWKYREEDEDDFAGWDWFCLSEPSVLRRLVDDEGVSLQIEQSHELPLPKSALPPQWGRIFPPRYSEIQWNFGFQTPRLCANGIGIREISEDQFWNRFNNDWISPFTYPNLSIFDPEGVLPLSLARDKLNIDFSDLEFNKLLIEDVVLDFLAYCLVTAPATITSSSRPASKHFRINYPGLFQKTEIFWIQTKEGLLLPEPEIIDACNLDSIVFYADYAATLSESASILASNASACYKAGHIAYMADPMRSQIYGWDRTREISENPINFSSARFLLSKTNADYWNQKKRLKKDVRSQIRETPINGKWLLWEVGTPNRSAKEDLIESVKDFNFDYNSDKIFLTHKTVAKYRLSNPRSLISEKWLELIGDRPIPWAVDERRKTLAKAFQALSAYIARWELYVSQQREEELSDEEE